MKKTLYDVIDSWTLQWDRGLVEITLNLVAEEFYKHKRIFYLLEEIWDVLELIDDPLEFMTQDRMIAQFERLLSNEQNELAAKSVQLEITDPPRFTIDVLNAKDLIASHSEWFEPWEGMTLSEFGAKLVDDSK